MVPSSYKGVVGQEKLESQVLFNDPITQTSNFIVQKKSLRVESRPRKRIGGVHKLCLMGCNGGNRL